MGKADSQGEVDDQFRAILEGLRTTLPGVQVLFAFLLVLPLQASFAEIRDLERFAYYVAFFGSAMSSVLLIAPSAHQRLRAPITGVERRSTTHLRITIVLTIVGTVIVMARFGTAVSAGKQPSFTCCRRQASSISTTLSQAGSSKSAGSSSPPPARMPAARTLPIENMWA